MIFQTGDIALFKDWNLRFEGIEDLDLFMSTYYVHPRPDLVADAIRVLPESIFLTQPGNAGGAVAFFSEVFAANPEMMAEWQKEIAKLDARTKNALGHSVEIAHNGGLLKLDDHSPQMNDMCWAAFCASGSTTYVDRVIGEFKNFDDRKDANLFYAGGTAMWSTAWNAKYHPLVKTTLKERQSETEDTRLRELIAKVLVGAGDNPNIIEDEIRAIYTKQHEAGVW